MTGLGGIEIDSIFRHDLQSMKRANALSKEILFPAAKLLRYSQEGSRQFGKLQQLC
jgi:hypothetical protein